VRRGIETSQDGDSLEIEIRRRERGNAGGRSERDRRI